jgi:hypothetical protein
MPGLDYKLYYMKEAMNIYKNCDEIKNTFSSSVYAPYLLLCLIERDIFIKTTDFTLYNKCVDKCDATSFEMIS